MKILMVLESDFPPDDRVEKEAVSLIRQGHTVTLACYTFNREPSESWHKGIRIIKKPISKFLYKSSVGALKFPFYFNFWSALLNVLLQENAFDALHIHDLPLAKVGLSLKNKYNLKLVLDLHENYPASLQTTTHTRKFLGRLLHSDRQWRRYERKYIQKADLLITVVEEMKERIIRLGADREKIIVVENTPLPDEFKVSDNPPSGDHITLFYAGGINIYRGLQVVVKALSNLTKEVSNIRLWIVGKGSYENKLRSLIRQLNLDEQVTFWGWKNLKEIADLLSRSDIALIPHLKSEQTDCSSPNKIFQYAYADKPIVCSNCNSLERLISEWKNGVVYRHDSPEDLSDKLLNLIKSGDYRQIGKNGKTQVTHRYNWNISVLPLLQAYKNMTEKQTA